MTMISVSEGTFLVVISTLVALSVGSPKMISVEKILILVLLPRISRTSISCCFVLNTFLRPRFIFGGICLRESPRPFPITSIDLFVVMVLNLEIFT